MLYLLPALIPALLYLSIEGVPVGIKCSPDLLAALVCEYLFLTCDDGLNGLCCHIFGAGFGFVDAGCHICVDVTSMYTYHQRSLFS